MKASPVVTCCALAGMAAALAGAQRAAASWALALREQLDAAHRALR